MNVHRELYHMEVIDQLRVPTALPWRRRPRYPVNTTLFGIHSRPGCCTELPLAFICRFKQIHSARYLLGEEQLQARETATSTPSASRLSRQCGSLDVSQRPVTGILLCLEA
jgi:hypothetical protein